MLLVRLALLGIARGTLPPLLQRVERLGHLRHRVRARRLDRGGEVLSKLLLGTARRLWREPDGDGFTPALATALFPLDIVSLALLRYLSLLDHARQGGARAPAGLYPALAGLASLQLALTFGAAAVVLASFALAAARAVRGVLDARQYVEVA